MYKAAILLNVSGFPQHGKIKFSVLVSRLCSANGGNGVMARPPRLSEHRLAMAGRNNGILGVRKEKDLSYLLKTSFRPIIPTPHHSNIPSGA